MDQLTGLRLFVRIVERGSFTAVARELGLSQSSVSRQIAALEDRLSGRLLLRTTRRLKPTEAGLKLYERATRALEELADAEAEVARSVSSHQGTLRVSASIAYGNNFVVPAVRAFLARFPRVRIDLIISDRYVDLVQEGVDVAVRLGALDDSTHRVRTLGRESLIAVAAPRYVRASGRPRSVEDLETHEGVVLLRKGVPARWTFRTSTGERQIALRGSLHVDSIVGAHAAVREGIGIGVLPSYLVEHELRSRVLVRLLPNIEAVGPLVQAVYPATRRLTSKAQSFIDQLAIVIGVHRGGKPGRDLAP